MEDAEFIKKCRQICSKLGTDHPRQMTFTVEGPCRFYKDEVIQIICGTNDLQMEIERVINRNPVIMVDESGRIYRTHGEVQHLHTHVSKLISNIEEGI